MLKRRTPKVVNRAKVAFRQAASTLIKSQSYLGAQYRRLRTRLGAPKAMTAMALWGYSVWESTEEAFVWRLSLTRVRR